jgi:P27 family predicted phage terminase small subunit
MGEAGRAGRKSKPAALKLLEGRAPGRDSGGRVVKTPPAFRRVAPPKPDHLTEAAASMWDVLVGQLQQLDLLKEVDGFALAIACETYSRWLDAKRMRVEARDPAVRMTRYGLLGETPQGVWSVAPWVRAEESAGREFRAFCALFGLSPSDEMRLAREASGADDGENDDLFG